MQDVIRINQEDNVAVALRSIEKGEDDGSASIRAY